MRLKNMYPKNKTRTRSSVSSDNDGLQRTRGHSNYLEYGSYYSNTTSFCQGVLRDFSKTAPKTVEKEKMHRKMQLKPGICLGIMKLTFDERVCDG